MITTNWGSTLVEASSDGRHSMRRCRACATSGPSATAIIVTPRIVYLESDGEAGTGLEDQGRTPAAARNSDPQAMKEASPDQPAAAAWFASERCFSFSGVATVDLIGVEERADLIELVRRGMDWSSKWATSRLAEPAIHRSSVSPRPAQRLLPRRHRLIRKARPWGERRNSPLSVMTLRRLMTEV